jgi:hypothetical protein
MEIYKNKESRNTISMSVALQPPIVHISYYQKYLNIYNPLYNLPDLIYLFNVVTGILYCLLVAIKLS